MNHPKDCRCPHCRVAVADAPRCPLHPRCLAPVDHAGACTTLRHIPLLFAKVVADRIAGALK